MNLSDPAVADCQDSADEDDINICGKLLIEQWAKERGTASNAPPPAADEESFNQQGWTKLAKVNTGILSWLRDPIE